MNKYSVLMSVYYKEKPSRLRRSIESTMEQTIVPDDFVIVMDGQLTNELLDVLHSLKEKYKCINLIGYPENKGLGYALNYGIKHTKHNLIMRMDSDDVCVKKRAEIMLPLMSEYDLIGGCVSEFDDEEDNINCIKQMPESYKKIKRYSKLRNPFNHPSVMFKKETIIKAGGYLDLPYLEDYYLWIRVLKMTSRVKNVQEVVVNMRTGVDMIKRRNNPIAKESYKHLRHYMLANKYINVFEYVFIALFQKMFLSSPTSIRKEIYNKVLRRNAISNRKQ